MSKSLAVWMYLRHQKKNAEDKVPIYVRVTIDGDYEDFSLSKRVNPTYWSQAKQKCTGKTQEAVLINSKIAKIKGDLTGLFDHVPVSETVKAKHLIQLYHGRDLGKEQQLKKDPHYHERVLTLIDQYLALKNKRKKVLARTTTLSHSDRVAEEFDALIRSIEGFPPAIPYLDGQSDCRQNFDGCPVYVSAEISLQGSEKNGLP